MASMKSYWHNNVF